jgi:Uncharacterized protein conserved in archaea
MQARARMLGVHLRIRDTKRKVREREGILIGEVTDFERGITRIRRLYVTAGRFALAEIESHRLVQVQRGEASRFIVLGNPFTQHLTNQCIQQHWNEGGAAEAAHLIENIMKTVAQKSASVSREYLLIRTKAHLDIEPVIERDQQESSR